MEIDPRFPTKLNSVSEVPEPFRRVLVQSLTSGKPVRLLVHAPAFETENEKSPTTVLAVTDTGWLVVSETEDGAARLVKSDFGDTLLLELTSILLAGELRISFAEAGTSNSVTTKFETVGDELYREAIDLILAGIDPTLTILEGRNEASMLEAWPPKIRSEAQRFWPKGPRFLAAIQWPAIFDEFRQQVAPEGALLTTERELVVISEDKEPSAEPPQEASSEEEPKERFGGIITFVPRVRLTDFRLSLHERFCVLFLQVHATHGGEELEVVFPSNEEQAVLRAMEQMLRSPGPHKPNC